MTRIYIEARSIGRRTDYRWPLIYQRCDRGAPGLQRTDRNAAAWPFVFNDRRLRDRNWYFVYLLGLVLDSLSVRFGGSLIAEPFSAILRRTTASDRSRS